MGKEAVIEEYNHWKDTIENVKSREQKTPLSTEEFELYTFANGFVSAINKSGVLED